MCHFTKNGGKNFCGQNVSSLPKMVAHVYYVNGSSLNLHLAALYFHFRPINSTVMGQHLLLPQIHNFDVM